MHRPAEMIVYGENEFDVCLAELVARLRQRCLAGPSVDANEDRIRLVIAGQIEQAAADAGLAHAAAKCSAVTAAAADRLLCAPQASSDADALHRQLEDLSRTLVKPTPVTVRAPEGYAWYGLYPEAYAQAARAWASQRERGSQVLVVGIRSIGTSLAAIVASELRRQGFEPEVTTVRPHGHPLARVSGLPAMLAARQHAIIVDEGPGLSGSTMASVATALSARGFAPGSISLIAGHAHGPGTCATDNSARWWSSVGVYATSLDVLEQRAGSKLKHELEAAAQTMLDEPLSRPLVDIGAGAWRDEHEQAESCVPQLEQPKLLARGRSGRSLLFKFAGFALARPQLTSPFETTAERQRRRAQVLADKALTAAPAGVVHGWLALPWVEGRRLSRRDLDEPMLARMEQQLAASAGPRLDERAAAQALEGLCRMLVHNTRELLGEAAAERAQRAGDERSLAGLWHRHATYGDGRLAPCEWIRTAAGVTKVDCCGHDEDHTIVGQQPLLWDVAGAIVEWDMAAGARDRLARVAGVDGGAAEVGFCCAAYAAFRAGAAVMLAKDETAARFYRLRLWRELSRFHTP